jgi:hypothetical protein
MFNALFGEYKLWSFCLLLPVFYAIALSRNKKIRDNSITELLLLGVINAILYLQYPTSYEAPIMVSSFRYSFPFFICLILAAFLLAKKFNKINLLGYFAIGNMIMVTSFAYTPKLVIFYLPLAFLCMYLLNKYAPTQEQPSPPHRILKKSNN